jgi:hypothetical protein
MTPADGRRGAAVGLFGVSTLLNAAMSLITIPIITGIAGAEHWASLATGQAIGASAAVVVIFGWGLTGPVTVAGTPRDARPAMYLDSLAARLVLLAPVLIVQLAVTVAIVPHEKVTAYVAGVAMTLAGASANWFFIGEGRAGRFLGLDTVPRVSGTLVGATLLALTGDLLLFAAAQLAGALVALVASAAVILRGSRIDVGPALRWRRIARSLHEQRSGIVATGTLAAFTPSVLAIVAFAAPAALPAFVLADRLARFGGMAVSPVLQMFQGWVPAASGDERVRRTRLAGAATGTIALATGVAYMLLLPTAADLLAHGQIVYSVVAVIGFGVIAALYVSASFVSTVALMAGRARLVALAAVVGVPLTLLILLATELTGLTDLAVWVVACGNLAMLTWQLLAVRAAFRRLTPDLTPNNPEPLVSLAGSREARIP